MNLISVKLRLVFICALFCNAPVTKIYEILFSLEIHMLGLLVFKVRVTKEVADNNKVADLLDSSALSRGADLTS